jgi:antitoxin (DNA-binding transcriptional repressor) of toxin-antitoxin stability system
MRRVSATEASREFADIIGRVERCGDAFIVERRGKDVAVIAPVRRSAGRESTVGDLIAAVRAAPPADGTFGADLKRIRHRQGRPRDRWASSSTRRS